MLDLITHFQGVTGAVFCGIVDSLRGCFLIFTLDRHIQKQRERIQESQSKSGRPPSSSIRKKQE